MELREIEIFLALTDELHFGRTASRLFVSQARVSQTIRSLEREVGGELFTRDSHSVRITPLGTALRDRLRGPYEEITTAVADVRGTAATVSGILRIAVANFAAAGPRWSDVVRTFRQRYPACGVTVHEEYPGEGLNRLRSGDLDVLVTWRPCDAPDLAVGPDVAAASRAVALPAGHRLLSQAVVGLDGLRDEALLVAAGDDAVETLAPVVGRTACTPVSVRVIEALGMVADGQGCYLTVGTLPTYYTHPGVVVRPVDGLPEARSVAVTSRRRRPPAATALIGILTDVGVAG